jgi:hypothetical protein
MAEEVPLRNAVAATWTVYRATHGDVDAADRRRCLLERHLARQWQNGRSDPESLIFSGLAYLNRAGTDEW